MITASEITNEDIWESFIKTQTDANFLQSWYWGEFHKRLQKTIIRTGFYNKNKLVGVMLAIIEPAKRGRYMTVPAGPLIAWEQEDVVDFVFREIRKIAHLHKCVFVRIRPQLIENTQSQNIFKDHGFVTAQMHLHAELTSRLSLSPTEETLLKNMRKTTRYEIRKGESLGISVTTTTDVKQIRQFYDFQVETAKRQKFVPFSYAFFKEQFSVFFENNYAMLYTATLDNKILAQAFIIFYNTEAVYHYGIGTLEGRKYPGASLIQWEAIKEAKKRGMGYYNFWGVAPESDKTHRFYTISIFKRGFGGEDTKYLRAQDLIMNKPLYAVNFGIEKMRRIIRRV